MELPSLEHRETLLRRYARLLADFGDEIGPRPLVWPSQRFFPDAFRADEASCRALVERLQQHAGLSDIPIEVHVHTGSAPPKGSCSSGGCGPAAAPQAGGLEETASGWRLHLPQAGLGHAVGLTTNLALALGQVFLLETSDGQRQPEPPVEVAVELACVALGLGTLLLQGSYIYAKSCGGPSVAQMTKLSVAELAILTAAFASMQGHSLSRDAAELGVTQAACLKEAWAWAESNGESLRALSTDPTAVAAGAPLSLVDTRSRLERWWHQRRSARNGAAPSLETVTLEQALAGGLSDEQLAALARTQGKPQGQKARPKDSDLAALVDEALRST